MTHPTLRLGARPAETRPRQPHLSGLRMMARAAPPKLIRSHINPSPLMLDNDTLGDCTSAGLGNSIRALSALNGFQTAITPQNAVSFYSASTGYVPGNAATDQGGIEVDVLGYAAAHGYPVQNQTLFPLWGTIALDDFNGMRLAMAAFGATYFGVQLALADQASIGAVWDTDTPASAGDPTPGSWGGHCLDGWSYTGTGDTDIVTLLTWGTTQRCTWRWLRSRLMEAHGVLWPQLATPSPAFLAIHDLEDVRAANAAFLNGAAAA
ncbi:hypothetical protein [Tanticharoenia sakaeratensis]|uniref:Uncharacterized protein n=1 Tax=Tanticharoenia sakaeratensis NBRC 103193 TaxID=1231623 RepID=A0A0D6MMJ9_9PROT|nr:hypothetical protein [Tanticharoenia sakaeratensis]GAN54897.1 hypothetical protein Tasa_033_011 [Tanticharoenia sakaeratensis NBRC 103193]GBQ23477.1 hypothetical protein AA103193_2429 [Tanticharoenia sakaeratensis NBRC 103193]